MDYRVYGLERINLFELVEIGMLRFLMAASLCVSTGAWAQAVDLHSRDINGDGTIDAYYDSTWNITYLADANIAATRGVPTVRFWDAGRMYYPTYITFGDSLDVDGVVGWRVPTSAPGPDCFRILEINERPQGCTGLAGIESEMVRMKDSIALIRNVQPTVSYATKTSRPELNGIVESPLTGVQILTNEIGTYPLFVWYVRDGDVPAIPEPQVWAMMLAGMAGVGLFTRRRRK